jgi:hypothetical protein
LTINPLVFDFISKQCKGRLHQNCYGKWKGLGFEVICGCGCGHNRLGQTLASVEGPRANAKEDESSFQEGTQNGYK